MADIKQIDTSKYRASGKVEIDGKTWSLIMPGAGKEMQFSKAQRRLSLLEKKIKSGDYNEADLDQYDKYEDFLFDFFKGIFSDGTDDNSEVDAWVEATPFSVITSVFDDIKEALES